MINSDDEENCQGISRYRARVGLVTRVGRIRPGTRGGFLSLEWGKVTGA